MAVVQCPNGHSYDNSRHARCPYCTGSQTIGVTVPLGVQETDGTGERRVPKDNARAGADA